MLIDSHCHIQSSEFYPDTREEVYKRAIEADVQMIVVGTSEVDSQEAVEFAAAYEGVWAVVGVHPHETKDGWQRVQWILDDYLPHQATLRRDSTTDHSLQSAKLANAQTFSPGQEATVALSGNTDNVAGNQSPKTTPKIVGIGEIGLDYFYEHSPREVQIRALEEQLQWAVEYNLPVSFHVREAYEDFWPVFDNFTGVRGVLHSFTDTAETLEKALGKGLYIGVNGISTFTKNEAQKQMFRAIPLERLLLETDAPFLTPHPFRGRINEPVFVREVAKHQADARDVALESVIAAATANTKALFAL